MAQELVDGLPGTKIPPRPSHIPSPSLTPPSFPHPLSSPSHSSLNLSHPFLIPHIPPPQPLINTSVPLPHITIPFSSLGSPSSHFSPSYPSLLNILPFFHDTSHPHQSPPNYYIPYYITILLNRIHIGSVGTPSYIWSFSWNLRINTHQQGYTVAIYDSK